MKFEVKKSSFLDALQMASNAIPSRSTLQILQNFLLRLQGNVLEVTATDLDLTISLRIEVEGHQEGGIVVNAKKILEVVKELPELPVLFSVDDYVATLRSESGFQCNITGFDISEYPGLPEVENAQSLEFAIKDLRFLTEKTLFAVSTDTTRAALTGILWEVKNGEMHMVATDGHRLGKAWIPVNNVTLGGGPILPPKALAQVLRMGSGDDAIIKAQIGPANAKFFNEEVSVYTKLIEGPYPNYENVIPKESSRIITVPREQLASVLRRVATMANAKSRQVKFSFQPSQIVLSAKNQDLGGDSEEAIPNAYDGEGIDVGFNANYLLEVLRLTNSEEVIFKINSPVGAIVIEPKVDDKNFFFIVMPLRLVEDA